MRRLKHGYTNHTVGDGSVVEKTYAGPDAPSRLAREHDLLTRLDGMLPVPPVRAVGAGTLTLGFVAGVQGQELLDDGHAEAVLTTCGRVLRRIHDAPSNLLGPGPLPPGTVVVHGDFGPNNVLLDPRTFEATAVLDWEFAHLGDPVEDLAWCEWIVRMHHPDRRKAVDHFFRAYGGDVPSWPDRRAVMVARCESLQEFCRRWEPDGPGVRQWQQRAAVTAGWQE